MKAALSSELTEIAWDSAESIMEDDYADEGYELELKICVYPGMSRANSICTGVQCTNHTDAHASRSFVLRCVCTSPWSH